MNYTEKYLTPHPLYDDSDFEIFCSKLPEFYFKKEVPEDVVKSFSVIKSLLAHSYFEYEFIDVAYSKALQSFEMAMSLRYRDYYPDVDMDKLMFNHLVRELHKLNVFETNLEVLLRLKWMRNNFSHPKHYMLGGITFWNRTEFICHIINEMYDDVNLRTIRKEAADVFIEEQGKLFLDGPVVLQVKNESMILFNMRLLFVNNKHDPTFFLIICTPLFDLQFDNIDDSIKMPFSFGLKIANPVFESNKMTAINLLTNEKIVFSQLQNHEQHHDRYEKWNMDYEKSKNKHLIDSGVGLNVSEILDPVIREFHRL